MKNNRKGFTLVELLAVIVILAILMVSAGAGVMATMNNSKVNLFKDEALTFIDGASRMYSDINMSTTNTATTYLVSNECAADNNDAGFDGGLPEADGKCQKDLYAGMCVTLPGLIANGATEKETSKYAGVILVEVPYDGGEARYIIWLHNSVYGINGVEKNHISKLSFNKKNNTETSSNNKKTTELISGGNEGVVTSLVKIKEMVGKAYSQKGGADDTGALGPGPYADRSGVTLVSPSTHGGTGNVYTGLTCINGKLG